LNKTTELVATQPDYGSKIEPATALTKGRSAEPLPRISKLQFDVRLKCEFFSPFLSLLIFCPGRKLRDGPILPEEDASYITSHDSYFRN
jgi:hypothetical protein